MNTEGGEEAEKLHVGLFPLLTDSMTLIIKVIEQIEQSFEG